MQGRRIQTPSLEEFFQGSFSKPGKLGENSTSCRNAAWRNLGEMAEALRFGLGCGASGFAVDHVSDSQPFLSRCLSDGSQVRILSRTPCDRRSQTEDQEVLNGSTNPL